MNRSLLRRSGAPSPALGSLLAAGLVLALAACSGSASSPAGSTSAATATSAATSAPAGSAPATSAAATSAPAGSEAAPTSAAPSPSPSGTVVTITVTGKTVTPKPGTVRLTAGQTVTLVVTSDVKNQLHLHGLDKEVDLPAGQPVTVTATYKDPGSYEVETHSPSLLLLRFEVQ